MHDLQALKDLKDKIWKEQRYDTRFGPSVGYKVIRRLTSDERKLIYRTIVKHNLIVQLYTQGNQGVGMTILQPDRSLGHPEYPGVEFHPLDPKPIINLWEDHFFDDKPITYTFRTWCKAYGTNAVDRAHKFFKAFADLPHNVPMMKRYNFREPYIISSQACHY